MAVHPPHSFGIVEDKVYRSNMPTHANFSYLRSLKIRTALILSPEKPLREFEDFVGACNINMVRSVSCTLVWKFFFICVCSCVVCSEKMIL